MTIHIALPGEKRSLADPLYKKRQQAVGLLNEKVAPAMTVTLAGHMLPENYPWSFALPLDGKRQKRFVTGALVRRSGEAREGGEIFALTAVVTYAWLSENLQSGFSMAFWLARILMALQHPDGRLDDLAALHT